MTVRYWKVKFHRIGHTGPTLGDGYSEVSAIQRFSYKGIVLIPIVPRKCVSSHIC